MLRKQEVYFTMFDRLDSSGPIILLKLYGKPAIYKLHDMEDD